MSSLTSSLTNNPENNPVNSLANSVMRRFSGWWQYVILTVFAFIFGFPLLWTFYSSFKTTPESVANAWALPAAPTLNGYREVLENTAFPQYYMNSIILTVMCAPLATLVSALAAFGFARVRFLGATALFYLFVAGIVLPIHVTLIPIFIIMRDLDLLGQLTAVVPPFVAFSLPVSIFILRGFFEQLPVELEDAARIDGASTMGIFWRIAFPLARPALVTVFILSAVAAWNEYLWVLTLAGMNNDAYNLPIGISTFTRAMGVQFLDRLFAGLFLSMVPILLFYFLAQKQIIRSLTAGALSGS